jgi:Tfp pilus assembly protein PilP
MWKVMGIVVLMSSSIAAQDMPLRDPFSPYVPSATSGPAPNSDIYVVPMVKLTGVIAGSEKSYAVLVFKGQRKIVSLGQTVGQYEVEVVTEDSVKLKGPDKTFILKIGQEIRL